MIIKDVNNTIPHTADGVFLDVENEPIVFHLSPFEDILREGHAMGIKVEKRDYCGASYLEKLFLFWPKKGEEGVEEPEWLECEEFYSTFDAAKKEQKKRIRAMKRAEMRQIKSFLREK